MRYTYAYRYDFPYRYTPLQTHSEMLARNEAVQQQVVFRDVSIPVSTYRAVILVFSRGNPQDVWNTEMFIPRSKYHAVILVFSRGNQQDVWKSAVDAITGL